MCTNNIREIFVLYQPSLLYDEYRVFPGVKERSERDADPSTPSSAIGHERVELYLYSPYGPYGLCRASVPVQGCTLTGLPRGKERPVRDADPTPPSNAVGHERVELYLYSPYRPYGLYRASVELYLYSPYRPYGLYRASVPVQECTLPLPLSTAFFFFTYAGHKIACH